MNPDTQAIVDALARVETLLGQIVTLLTPANDDTDPGSVDEAPDEPTLEKEI